jgi:hypothetical protein
MNHCSDFACSSFQAGIPSTRMDVKPFPMKELLIANRMEDRHEKVLVACSGLLFSRASFGAQDKGLSGKLSARANEKAADKQCENAAGKRTGGDRKAFIEACLSSRTF